jgi:hypothetical protein
MDVGLPIGLVIIVIVGVVVLVAAGLWSRGH